MKKFRKMLCLVLALAMAASLTACGSSETSTTAASTTAAATTAAATEAATTEAATTEAAREHVTVKYSQYGNALDDADGYENDPIRQAIADAVGIDLEYDTGADGYWDRMNTELYADNASDLFSTYDGETLKKWIEDELITDIGAIINADPERYPILYKMINDENYKAYNKLYTGDSDSTYAIYSVFAFADPVFGGVPIYNQSILDEVNGGAMPTTVDEFLAYCSAAGEAGYIGWWPRNDKGTNWYEVDATLGMSQGTSIQAPSAAGTGTILEGELGTDTEKWVVSTTSEASKAVVKQLVELYKTGGLDANFGTRDDFDDGMADYAAGKVGAACYGDGYPGQYRDFFNEIAKVDTDATMEDYPIGTLLTNDGEYGTIYISPYWVSYMHVIPATCEYADRVLDLVEFLASNEGQGIIHNCTDGVYNTTAAYDYVTIDTAYGYGDGRMKYCWFTYLFAGGEYAINFEDNADWWTAENNTLDFSDQWADENDLALVSKSREVLVESKAEGLTFLPSYYGMVAMPAEASDIVSKLQTITNEYLTQFIGGQLDVDADWDKYVAAYEEAGVAELEQMLNDAVAEARTSYAD